MRARSLSARALGALAGCALAGCALAGCALALGLAALGCQGPSERAERSSDTPVIVLPEDPVQPVARRPSPAPRAAPEAPLKIVLEEVDGAEYHGWIRPADQGAHTFTPDAAQVAALERTLPDAARTATERGDWPADLALAEYARQYRGYRVDDVAVIAVDLYCAKAKHLAGRVVSVTRGGDCFLHTAYEVESGRFRYFARNPR